MASATSSKSDTEIILKPTMVSGVDCCNVMMERLDSRLSFKSILKLLEILSMIVKEILKASLATWSKIQVCLIRVAAEDLPQTTNPLPQEELLSGLNFS